MHRAPIVVGMHQDPSVDDAGCPPVPHCRLLSRLTRVNARVMESVHRTADAVRLYGRARVRAEVRRGRWQRPERGVVVCHNGPLTRREEIAVALAVCPPASAVGGITALELDGYKVDRPTKPIIVLPEGARRPTTDRLVPHWSTVLTDLDVHPSRSPRRTRTARSVVDQAAWSITDRGARVVVLSAAQQGLVRPRDVREALLRRGPCRWRAVIVESVLDAWGGIQSLPERDFELIRRQLHLPRPSRQRVMQRNGRRYYLDVAWEEYEAACEIHGMPHLEVQSWDTDLDRANDVVIEGPRLVAFSSFVVRHRPARVGEQLVGLLRRGGWETNPDASRPDSGRNASRSVR